MPYYMKSIEKQIIHIQTELNRLKEAKGDSIMVKATRGPPGILARGNDEQAEERRCFYCDIPEQCLQALPQMIGISNLISTKIETYEAGNKRETTVLTCFTCNHHLRWPITSIILRKIGQQYIKPAWVKQIKSSQS